MKVAWNQYQLLPTFDFTITVLNKLSAKDSVTKQDVWYKTVLHNCAFSSEAVKNVTGTTVGVGNTFISRIPKNEKYLPYSEWKNNPDEHFTLNTGDYIIKGELDESEIVAPNTIQTIYQNHRENAFSIRTFKDNTNVIEVLEHYRVEGV